MYILIWLFLLIWFLMSSEFAAKSLLHLLPLAGDLTKPWESGLSLCHKFVQRGSGHSSDEKLLIKKWVIRSQCAGHVMVLVIVVAQSCASFRWEELIDINSLTNVHHQSDT